MARTEALRRNRTIRFALGANNSWTVLCDPADPTLENGVPICPGVLLTREGSEGSANAEVASNQFLTGTTTEASSPVFAGSLRFTPLGRVDATTLPGGSVATFSVTNPRGGTCQADGGDMRCLRIVVTTGGQVRMCDPAVEAVGDPRRCNELLPAS
jgi:type IV fimbrial biogenesis protein FimT